jgi:hypothetical protein
MYRPAPIAFCFAAFLSIPAFAQQGGTPIPSLEQRAAGMTRIDGYFYTTGLAAGPGSNDIGLDRGQRGSDWLVTFQRVGPRVMLVQGNESFRSSANPAERRSVADSFARPIPWGFAAGAESNGHVLVDATDFFLRDGDNAGNTLRPGTWRVDRTRSAFYMERTKAFPKNTGIEVALTFANEAGGRGGGGGGPAYLDAIGDGDPEVKAELMRCWADRRNGAATLRWREEALSRMTGERFDKGADFVDKTVAA